jgi:DNA modification methylase
MKGFDIAPDPFKTAKDKYGIWPTTVWELDYSDKVRLKLKALIGDSLEESARADCFTKRDDSSSYYRGKITVSIFNPVVAMYVMNIYAPKTGLVYDPFAGGGTRAIITNKYGLDYLGVELRQQEIDLVKARLERNGVNQGVTLIQGDSTNVPQIQDNVADFLITCPPYYNMEVYNGGPDDLSMCGNYDDFLVGMGQCIRETGRILKPGALSCWVVGLTRGHDSDLPLMALNHDISRLHKERGFELKEEVILVHKNNSAVRRVAMFDLGKRMLIRTHEYLLLFQNKKETKNESTKGK